MKLYLAAGKIFLPQIPETPYRYLASFFYDVKHTKSLNKIHDSRMALGCDKIFLDSGGFTGRVQGVPISIFKYARFVEQYKHLWGPVANLDVGPHEAIKDNQRILDRIYSPVLPVLHPEEFFDLKLRDWFEGEMKGRDYVAVGGIVGYLIRNAMLKRLEDARYFDWVFDRAHKYGTKVHGFGVTTVKTMIAYPFYSVDSSTWLSCLKFNLCQIFDPKKMKFQRRLKREIALGKGMKPKEATMLVGSKADIVRQTVKEYYQMEKTVTAIWKRNGVDWEAK